MRCKNCKEKFEVKYFLQKFCREKDECIVAFNEVCKVKIKKDLAKIKKDLNIWRKSENGKLMTHSNYIQLFQVVFNTFIKLRDRGEPCISCEVSLEGKKHDAGHCYPTTYQFLRFNEDNVHSQCVQCNQHKRANLLEYLPRLEKKIGVDRLQWLHAHRHDRFDLSIPELKDLIAEYKFKIKKLKK